MAGGRVNGRRARTAVGVYSAQRRRRPIAGEVTVAMWLWQADEADGRRGIVIRIYAIRASGALLLIAATLITLLFAPPFGFFQVFLYERSALFRPDSVTVVVNIALSAMFALGLLGLLLAQRGWLGRLGALAALSGLLLFGALLLPRGIGLGALNVALTGLGLFAPLDTSFVPLPLLELETLAALLFIGGLIACGLAARAGSALRWWWTPLALGAWSLVVSVLETLYTHLLVDTGALEPQTLAPSLTVLVVNGALILLFIIVPLLLWALLGVALLAARARD